VCAVGDPEQSIYSWRGADISNILDFEKDFKDAKVILLEQNYRSTQNILDVANEVIKNNTTKTPKNLWTAKEEGEYILYEQLEYAEKEAYYVANNIERLLDKGYKASDIAILYRTNAQSRTFEEAFMRERIPYKIVGGLKFYDRKEVKDIVAYLKVLENPHDNISLKRIINTPKRGIGNATVEKIENYAIDKGESIYSALLSMDELDFLTTRAKNCVVPFMEMMSTLMAKKEVIGLQEFIEDLIE